eukprot:Hpha_TRINITY_DN31497_c0_g1::TRINITY_DN31497_c0_g1_i1::g.145309::m.145309
MALPRFNIALLPDTNVQHQFVQLAQQYFGHVADGYLLGAEALAHVTLGQFRAADEQVALAAFADLKDKGSMSLRLNGFKLRETSSGGQLWAEVPIDRDAALLDRQRSCIEHLTARGLDALTPSASYSPHITLARIPDANIKLPGSILDGPEDATVEFRLAVGHSTEKGVFVKEL